jgi:hypothetical protein
MATPSWANGPVKGSLRPRPRPNAAAHANIRPLTQPIGAPRARDPTLASANRAARTSVPSPGCSIASRGARVSPCAPAIRTVLADVATASRCGATTRNTRLKGSVETRAPTILTPPIGPNGRGSGRNSSSAPCGSRIATTCGATNCAGRQRFAPQRKALDCNRMERVSGVFDVGPPRKDLHDSPSVWPDGGG